MSRWAVILAGGSGTRFWPLSAPSEPKQVLPLLPDGSTAQQALRRLQGLVEPDHVLVVTGAALAGPLREHLALPASQLLIEPRAASTAPALLWASLEAGRRDPDAEVICLHADWNVSDPAAFRRAASSALDAAAAHDRLVLIGIVPTRVDTGFGYIVSGESLGGAREVRRFIEKPRADAAAALIGQGALWNSGCFAWTPRRLRDEVVAVCPEVAVGVPALEAGDVAGFFGAVDAISIDVGVLERSQRVAVVPGAFPWDDIGTWNALARARPRDPLGNVTQGRVHAHEARDNIVWTEDDAVVLDGVHGLVVVRARGRTLVTTRERAPDLKRLLDALPADVRDLE